MRSKLLILSLCIFLSSYAEASPIPNRLTLNGILDGNAVTEGFEAITVGAASRNLFTTVLDASTVVPALFPDPQQGPGLVVNGIRFNGSGAILNVEHFVTPTTALSLTPSRQFTLLIDFSVPVNAVGFDFFPFISNTNVSVRLFGTDTSSLLESATVGVSFPTFIGFQESSLIGRIAIDAAGGEPIRIFDVRIDNVEFGSAPTTSVPEPSALVLWGSVSAIIVLVKHRIDRRSSKGQVVSLSIAPRISAC